MDKKAIVRRSKPSRSKQALVNCADTIAELDQLTPTSSKAARAIALFKFWLQDESGYDERTWPKVKKSLDQERDRVGARRLFHD